MSSATANIEGPAAPVRGIMSEQVARVSPDANLAEVAQKLCALEAGALAVGSVERVEGIISERDLVRSLARRDDPRELRASDMASTDLLWVAPTTTIADAARAMEQRRVRHALVGDASNLLGIVSARDLLAALCP